MAHAEQDLMDRLRASSINDMDRAEADCVGDDGDALSGPDAKELYFGLLSGRPQESTLAPSNWRFACPMRKRSEEHTSELQSLMRISYAVFCLKKKKKTIIIHTLD